MFDIGDCRSPQPNNTKGLAIRSLTLRVFCSHFAPTHRPANAHRLKPTRRRRGLLIGKHQLIELLRLRLVELGHEVAVPVERGLNRGVAQLRLDVLRVGAAGNQQACVWRRS